MEKEERENEEDDDDERRDDRRNVGISSGGLGRRIDRLVISMEKKRVFGKFRTIEREASFAIRPIREIIEKNLRDAFFDASRELRTYAIDSSEPGDRVGMSMYSADSSRGPAILSFRPARDVSPEDIRNLMISVSRSDEFSENGSFRVRVFNVAIPSGRGRVKLTNDKNENVAKRSIVRINNSDDLCFPRALVVALAYLARGKLRTGELHRKWNMIRHRQSTLQRESALRLTRNAGVTITEDGCGIPEIERFQRYLANDDIAIVVYYLDTFGLGGKPMYDGIARLASLGREPSTRLNIIYRERSRHYDPILNLKAASGFRNYCEPCNKGYRNDKTGHRCPKKHPPRCKVAAASPIELDRLSDSSNSERVRTLERYLTLLTSAEREVIDVSPVNDETIRVSLRSPREISFETQRDDRVSSETS